MKYRTMIEIVSDANSENEALDIVGEFLSGNITSGVNMKCVTDPIHSYPKMIAVTLLFLALLGGTILSTVYSRPGTYVISNTPGVSAVQPPLTMTAAEEKMTEFKKEWQTMQVKEMLRSAK